MYPRRPVTPTRSAKSTTATSPRTPGKSKHSAKALGHGQFPGAGECFPIRRTSSTLKGPPLCELRMIEKLKDRGEEGMKTDMLFNAAIVFAERRKTSFTRENYDLVLEEGPFRGDRVFYSAPPSDEKPHHATPARSSRRPAPYHFARSSSGSFRSPGSPEDLHHPAAMRAGPSSSSFSPEPMVLSTRSYNSRPSTPATGIHKSPPFLSPGSRARTASSILSKLPNPIESALIEYITKDPSGSRPLKDVIQHILTTQHGFWNAHDVGKALKQGPFVVSCGTVKYEPEY